MLEGFFRRYFSVSGRCRGQISSLVVPLVVVFKVLVFVVILVFVWGNNTVLKGVEIQGIKHNSLISFCAES